MRPSRRVIIGAAMALTIAVLATGGMAAAQHWSHLERIKPPATGSVNYGSTPTYRLLDQNGQHFSSRQLHGKVQVISYLFPYCTSYCPLIARNLALTEQLIDRHGLAGKVAFVAFNVDPGGAGPAVLSRFLKQERINPDDPAWHFLTGSTGEVAHVVRDGFHVYYQKVTLAQEQRAEKQQQREGTYTPRPDQSNAIARKAHVYYDIVHNDTIEIAGPHGHIRDFLDSGDRSSPQRLYRDIAKAIA